MTDTKGFWHLNHRTGRPPIYDDPQDLWQDCLKYFDERSAITWNDQPLPFTQTSLIEYLGIASDTWHRWRQSGHLLSGIVMRVDAIMRDQKLSGAIVGAYNSSIVAKDLGMADKRELTGANGGPIQSVDLSSLSDDQLAKLEDALLPLAGATDDPEADQGGTEQA